MSSVSGLFASPFLGPYSLSKFALEAFTDSLRREMAFFGVKVCSVNPGPIKTPIWDKGFRNPEIQKLYNHPVYGKILRKFEKGVRQAVDRALDVDEVVKVVDEMVQSDKPRLRVVVANRGTRVAMKALKVMPDVWIDSLIKRF
jgi:NAD(P)-dependent dehydrogenase (short-subunit alcohol dehydrogenase family)